VSLNPQQIPASPYERAFGIFGLLLVLRALRPLYTPWAVMSTDSAALTWSGAYDVAAGNLSFQIPSAAMFVISALLLFRDREKALELLAGNKLLLLFLGITLASMLWAQDPDTAFRRSVALIGTSLFGFYLATRYSNRQLIEIVAVASTITVVQTILVSVLIPSVGVHADAAHAGSWRGVLGHKNDVGRIMVLSALLAFVAWRDKIGHWFLGWPTLVLAIFVVLMTTSKTSLLVLLALMVSIPMFRALRRSNIPVWLRVGVLVLLAIAPVVFLGLNFYEAGLELMGRNATLTGRTDIWEKAIEIGVTRPWLGFGYRSFWISNGAFTWFMPGHGHNSYLDLWLETGIVGATAFGLASAAGVRRSFWRLSHTNDSLGMWFILYLLYLGMFGMTAPAFPQQGTIEWVLYCVVLMQLAPMSKRAEAPDRHPSMVREGGGVGSQPAIAGR
jgi:O-antigen ligase